MKTKILLLSVISFLYVEMTANVNPVDVTKWVELTTKVQEYSIDMSKYPIELNRYCDIISSMKDKYMSIIGEAEYESYDGKNVDSKLKTAEKILSDLKSMKQIFDEYVLYITKEKSTFIIESSKSAVMNSTPFPRMNQIVYSAMVGKYPVEIVTIEVNSKIMFKHVYSDGKNVVFVNDRFVMFTDK